MRWSWTTGIRGLRADHRRQLVRVMEVLVVSGAEIVRRVAIAFRGIMGIVEMRCVSGLP